MLTYKSKSKRIIAGFIALLMMLSATACGRKEDSVISFIPVDENGNPVLQSETIPTGNTEIPEIQVSQETFSPTETDVLAAETTSPQTSISVLDSSESEMTATEANELDSAVFTGDEALALARQGLQAFKDGDIVSAIRLTTLGDCIRFGGDNSRTDEDIIRLIEGNQLQTPEEFSSERMTFDLSDRVEPMTDEELQELSDFIYSMSRELYEMKPTKLIYPRGYKVFPVYDNEDGEQYYDTEGTFLYVLCDTDGVWKLDMFWAFMMELYGIFSQFE